MHGEATGKNCVVSHKGAYLKYVYRGVDDGGIKKITQLVLPRTRPHTGREGGRVKDK